MIWILLAVAGYSVLGSINANVERPLNEPGRYDPALVRTELINRLKNRPASFPSFRDKWENYGISYHNALEKIKDSRENNTGAGSPPIATTREESKTGLFYVSMEDRDLMFNRDDKARDLPGGWSGWQRVPTDNLGHPTIENANAQLYDMLPYQVTIPKYYRFQVVNGKNYEVLYFVCGNKEAMKILMKFGKTTSCIGKGNHIYVKFHKSTEGEVSITSIEHRNPPVNVNFKAQIPHKTTGSYSEWEPVPEKILNNQKMQEKWAILLENLGYQIIRADGYRVQLVNGRNYQIKFYVCGKKNDDVGYNSTCTGGKTVVVSVYVPPGGTPVITDVQQLLKPWHKN